MIKIEHIHIKKKKTILDDACIILYDHAINVVYGASGTGKTLLLYIAGLLQTKDEFNYSFNGIQLDNLSKEQYATFIKNNISFVFQENSLIEYATVYDNLKLTFILHHKKYSDELFLNILRDVHLDIRLEQKVNELSRGQRQRLSIAIALIKEPNLLILDEPTSFLDRENEMIIIKLVKEISVNTGVTVLIASHSQEVMNAADYLYEIKNYQILPKNEFTVKNSLEVIKKERTSLSFIYEYIRLYMLHHVKEYVKLFCLILLVCSAVLFNKSFSQLYISRQINNFNEQLDTGIVIYSENIIDFSMLDQIMNIEHIVNAYYNKNISVICEQDGKEEIVTARIGYSEQLQFADSGVYVTEEEINTSQKYYLLEDTTKIELPIMGVISNDYKDPVSNQKSSIVVSYDEVKDFIDPQNIVVVFIDSIENTFIVQEQLLHLNSGVFVYPLAQELNLIKDNLGTLAKLSNIFSFIIISISSIIIIGTYTKSFSNRNKEFQILKSMGLSNRDIVRMILLELIVFLGCSWIIFGVIEMLLPHILSGYGLLTGMLYISVLMVFVSIYTVRRCLKKEIADVLRR